MPIQPFGRADPQYDALRVRSLQELIGLGDTAVGGLFNRIYLWPADGSTLSDYDPDEAGLTAALTAATTGDTVWLPSIKITVTAAVALVAGVLLRGIDTSAEISRTANSAVDLVTLQAPASGAAYLSHVTITCTQSGAGDAIALNGGAGDASARDSNFNGQSTGGAGYGVRGSTGTITLDDCWIQGSTAPLDATAASYSIGSQISTGTINGTDVAGAEISGLTIGNWYAVEATGGPFNLLGGAANWDSYRFYLNTSGTLVMSSSIAPGWAGANVINPNTLLLNRPAWTAYAEAVDTRRARIYFRATTTSIWFWCADGPPSAQYGDNTGTLGWKLSNATAPSSNVVTHAARLDPVTGEPAQGDRGVWDALNYRNRHTNDIDDDDGIHHTLTALDDRYLGSGFDWYNVRDYGALGDGVTDDTTAISDTIAAIPAAGGVLYFPAGKYLTSGGFVLNKPITVRGNGSGSGPAATAISVVYCNSATANLFAVSVDGVSFYDLELFNNAGSTPSAGAAIYVSDNGNQAHYNNIIIDLFYDGFHFDTGGQWVIDGVAVFESVRYGLFAKNIDYPDWGDWVVTNSYFVQGTRAGNAAIHIESGGGGKISNVKTNGGFTNAIEVSVSGVQTSILLLSNNSIENFHGDGIHITSSGSSPDYSLINIVGNQFGAYLSNSGGNAIDIAAANLGEITQVLIDGNQFRAGTGITSMGYAISLTKLDNVRIGSYTINANWTGLLTQTGCTNVVQDGSGTVTSVTAGTGLTATPNPITTTGTITLNATLDNLSDVNTAGEATGDIIYDNAGTWIPYPLGIGTRITVSGTKIRFGNVAGGNYLEIDSVTGTLRLAGDATAWDDMRIAADVVKAGATAPNWKAFGPSGNIQALMFEASHHDEAMFQVQLPHQWKVGTNIYPHVHWAPVNTTAGNVVWELEYIWANIDGTFGAPSNMATDATAAGGTAWVHKLTDLKEGGNNYISGSGKTMSSMLMCRIHRNSNSGSDTLNQDVALLEVDFHFEIDSFGSDTRDVKDASASLLLETGDILLLETGDRLLTE